MHKQQILETKVQVFPNIYCSNHIYKDCDLQLFCLVIFVIFLQKQISKKKKKSQKCQN